MKKLLSLLLVLALVFAAGAPAVLAVEDLAGEMEELVAPSKNVRVPPATVRARAAGGTEYLDKFGVTRRSLVGELTSHLYDNYYLGTAQASGDWQSPRGDTSYNGGVGMNCAGFVAYVLRKSGMDGDAVTATMKLSPWAVGWGTGRRYEYLSAASNYLSLIEYGNLVAHVYESRDEMLASGMLEKGDVILRFWTDDFRGSYTDNHLMIFWGDSPYENKVWHSSSGNNIGQIANVESCYIIIKFAPDTVAGFNDVRADDWYASSVEYAKENGYMQGTAPASFEPSGVVTRAQLVQVLYNMAGKPVPETLTTPFVDIRGHWAGQAITWAYGASVSEGVDSTHFAPESPVTREQAAQLFKGFREYRTGENVKTDSVYLNPYADRALISDWAEEGMVWAVQHGLMSGSYACLSPQDQCTRAQLAQVIQNYFKPTVPVRPISNAVYGVVRDEAGNPIVGAQVTVSVGTAVTGDRGEYNIYDIYGTGFVPGTYTCRVKAEGFAQPEAVEVTLKADGTAARQDFTLEKEEVPEPSPEPAPDV